MFRVAVILNESELLRSGYAHVTRKLERLPRLSSYAFESFTSVNVKTLFAEGPSALHQFDSLVISTNATSDATMLGILREHREHIAGFLAQGKGVFIGSQKKLSQEANVPKTAVDRSRFLPEEYDFCTRERPKDEWDSGVGRVFVASGREEHPLISFPERVSAKMVEERCEHNEFRRHFYRSHLEPAHNGVYDAILVDSSHGPAQGRVLLMANSSPLREERLVVSTIALDWEFHEALLTNVLVYVTEGIPRVAFIRRPDSRDGDYDFLLTSAKVSKIPHAVYCDTACIPTNLRDIHNTFIFSPGWERADIVGFLQALHADEGKKGPQRNPYRRLYFFQRFDGFLTLTQHSTFSTVDLIVGRACLWLSAQYGGHMWGRSFWLTHDIVHMMIANGADIIPFTPGVLADIQRHDRGSSYDGVMGATCGLLELLVELDKVDASGCRAAGFDADRRAAVCEWVIQNFDAQSVEDKWTAFLALSSLGNRATGGKPSVVDGQTRIVQSMTATIEGYLSRVDLVGQHVTELDLCKLLKIALIWGSAGKWFTTSLITRLHERQGPSGEWANVGRTAHVLITLLENWSALLPIVSDEQMMTKCQDMMYNAVLFLRSEYDWNAGNWGGDLQATANAAHAMGLYNRQYKQSTQECAEALASDAAKIQSANLIKMLGGELLSAYKNVNVASARAEEMTRAKQQSDRLLLFEPYWRYGAFCLGALLLGLLAYLVAEQRTVMVAAFKAVGLLSTMVGLVIGLVAGWFASWAARRNRNSKRKTG